MIIVQRQAELLEVVGALAAAGRLASRLHRRQQERDQHANNCNHHEQLDQRESPPTALPIQVLRQHECLLPMRRIIIAGTTPWISRNEYTSRHSIFYRLWDKLATKYGLTNESGA